jgi:hypothetical protein
LALLSSVALLKILSISALHLSKRLPPHCTISSTHGSLPKKGQKKITVVMPEDLYVEFSKKVLDEKKKLAISEKIVELVQAYLRK